MELKTVPIENPADINFILGQSHFIKTIEDLHEAIVQTVPGTSPQRACACQGLWDALRERHRPSPCSGQH